MAGIFVSEDFQEVEGGVVVVNIVVGGGGLGLLEDAAGGVEVVAEVVEVLLRGVELAGIEGASKDDDGEEEAEEGDGAVAAPSLDLANTPSSEAPV